MGIFAKLLLFNAMEKEEDALEVTGLRAAVDLFKESERATAVLNKEKSLVCNIYKAYYSDLKKVHRARAEIKWRNR